jgi:uncharacterized coiled-coil protein SlyX
MELGVLAEAAQFPAPMEGFMEDSAMQAAAPVLRRVAPVIVAVVIGGSGLGYAVHEHHAAQNLAAQNAQESATLNATRTQLNELTAKVNALTAQNAAAQTAQPAQPAAAAPAAPLAPVTQVTTGTRSGKPRAGRPMDRRFNKLQAQLDEQNKAIEQTRGDLASTRTELTGSIAHTHDELVVLEKRGESNYFEFEIQKSKEFRHEGPVGVSLRKANVKHQYADLQLMVDDRNLVQKHVNLDQPVMFYMPDTEQPIQIVINNITKDHIHGYVSAPKYRKSELAAMSDANTNAAGSPDQATSAQPPARKRLTVAKQDGSPQDGPQ